MGSKSINPLLLTSRQTKDAIRFCARNKKLKPLIPEEFFTKHSVEWGTSDFVVEVSEFQAVHGLTVDGKPGKRQTIPAMVSAHEKSDQPTDCLIFKGNFASVPGVRVVNAYHSEGYSFDDHPGHTHGSFSRSRPRAIVLHDSVTRTSDACFNVLRRRRKKNGHNMGLGTAIIVSPSGTVYQCVKDLATVTWHCKGWNRYAIGLDVVSMVDPKFSPHSPLRRKRTSWTGRRGFLDYTDEQKLAISKAVPVICELVGVQFNCPRNLDMSPATSGYGSVACGGKLNPKTFGGVVAHGQVSNRRWDGNRALEVLFGDAGTNGSVV